MFALRTELNLTTQAWYGCETSKGIVVSNRCLAKDRTSVLTHGSTQRQANFLPKETSLLESKKRLTLPPDPSNTRIQGAYADIWQQSAQSWSPVRHPGRSHSSFEFRAPSSLAPHAEPSQTWQQRVMTAKHQRQASLLCSLLLSLVTSILGSICTLPFFRGSVLMYRRNDKECVCQNSGLRRTKQTLFHLLHRPLIVILLHSQQPVWSLIIWTVLPESIVHMTFHLLCDSFPPMPCFYLF